MTAAIVTPGEEAQLGQTIEMFEVIIQSQPYDCQSLEILKEAYHKLGREKDLINTSKRLAEAYVHLGQLSSAILEYESLLQRRPDDPDVLAALGAIESKANSLSAAQLEATGTKPSPDRPRPKEAVGKVVPTEIDDGRQAMHKLFVLGKAISAGDFDLCWQTPDLSAPPGKVIEPFIQLLADKGLLPIEKSLTLLCDKTRLAYLPLEKYDVDIELIRSYPPVTLQRWCVVPIDRMSKSVLVATANPFNRQAAKELEAVSRRRLIWYLSPPMDLIKIIRKLIR
jgi:tetratricopeptide (TPR) repeat protein